MITPIPSNTVRFYWDKARPLLEKVLNRIDTGHTPDDVLRKLLLTQMQLWNINDWQALAVTQITILPQCKTLEIVYCAGDGVDDWLTPLIVEMKKFKHNMGCQYLEFHGRMGWEKRMKKLGFDKTYITMRFE